MLEIAIGLTGEVSWGEVSWARIVAADECVQELHHDSEISLQATDFRRRGLTFRVGPNNRHVGHAIAEPRGSNGQVIWQVVIGEHVAERPHTGIEQKASAEAAKTV